MVPAGTKRPMRMFYGPLAVPSNATSPNPVPECWFAYAKSALKIPHQLEIHRAPISSDCGNTGIWNNNEFILKVLDLAPATDWTISECHYDQWNLKSMSISGIAEVLGQPGQVPVAGRRAAASSSGSMPGPEEVDWSAFDASSLFAGPLSCFPHMADDGNLFAGLDEDHVFEDVEVQSEHEFLLAEDHAVDDPEPKEPAAEVDFEAESAKSEQSNASVASGMKTMATDTSLLQQTLGSRPDVCKDRLC